MSRTQFAHKRRFAPFLVAFALGFSTLGGVACTKQGTTATDTSPQAMRDAAKESSDPNLVGRWLLTELVAPGGEVKQARAARKRLDELKAHGLYADFARALDDSSHGQLAQAAESYLAAVMAARNSGDPLAPLIAWYAAREAQAHSYLKTGFWKTARDRVLGTIDEPGAIGWRARGELVDWAATEAWSDAETDVDKRTAKRLGCADHVRLAGPFGRGTAADLIRNFPAEAPGPWPSVWEPDATMAEAPRILKTKHVGCLSYADEPVSDGAFYAESFVELDAPREVLIAVQGAHRVWVNDTLVGTRDIREWGAWLKFGVLVKLPQGRNRVLAKLTEAEGSIRLMSPDGRPAKFTSSIDAAPGYTLVPPVVSGEPNVLSRYLKRGEVVAPNDALTRTLAASLALTDGEADVAAVMLEPLVKEVEHASPLTLSHAAEVVETDPIYDGSQAKDLVRELQARASKADPGLWRPRLATALWEAERSGPTAAIEPVRALVKQFPSVPQVAQALARLYGELGWSAEYKRTILQLAADFPDSTEALMAAVEVHDSEGQAEQADALVRRIQTLDPDSEVQLTRALARQDYDAALTELRRFEKRRPDRKDLSERIFDVMVRAGNETETWKKLEAAVKKNPKNERSRLALADAHLAAGKSGALAKALADAVQVGGNTSSLEEALDLIDGTTALEPYRIDGRQVIREYEARGEHMPGTAARVLDYAAVWVRSDGSSRMLEHEVIRVQSAEAISKFAEHPLLGGLVLHMRVIKQNGQVLEPEFVAGKQSVTLPHLEVGDYVETEHIMSFRGDGQQGKRYLGPHWFFREENIAYARSEFVVVAPEIKGLVVETRNQVPAPEVTQVGPLTVRRWRVDFSEAAPSEPDSAPLQEFLPSVRIGWGIELEESLLRLHDNLVDLTPVDPRIARLARSIVKGVPQADETARARQLYRWIVDNVEEGEETDGRRVIISKNGNRWRGFMTLCHALDIEVSYAVAQSRLATPAISPLSEAGLYTVPLLSLGGSKHPTWLTVSSKYAPFGYVPAEVRGMPGYILSGTEPQKTMIPEGGTKDGVTYSGTAKVDVHGSATAELVLEFHGKYATGIRSALATMPENQIRDALESGILGKALRGAQLKEYQIGDLDDLDAPLSFHLKARVPHFAQKSGQHLILSPPFMPELSRMVALPNRRTPLLLGEANYQKIRLNIELPAGSRVVSRVGSTHLKNEGREVQVDDKLEKNTLTLMRVIDLPAGRVQPAQYPRFVDFARQADDALAASIRIQL
jgi:tetratricopeptide (TPR) repeat protein